MAHATVTRGGPGPDGRDVALGIAVTGVRAGLAAGRAALASARLATHVPVIGSRLRGAADALGAEGLAARARARAQLEVAGAQLLAAPASSRAVDHLLAGPLPDAIGRSLGAHRILERIAAQVLATADLDAVVAAVVEDERTAQVLERALASPGLERLALQVLESRLVDALTERVLTGPELERVVEHVATSPQVLDAVAQQTQTLAQEVTSDVRFRSQEADDRLERTVRGWLRRPRTQEP
jgi:hypothetical protein